MDWLQLISAIGIGALLTKILDIVWLQRSLQASEKKRWLREQRLRVYSKLAEEILSLGKNKGVRTDVFLGYSLAAEATLLVDNEKLAYDIEAFFTKLSNLFSEASKAHDDPSKKDDDELEGAYQLVYQESRRLVIELRKSIHKQ